MKNELYALTTSGETFRGSLIPKDWYNVIMIQENNYMDILLNLPPKHEFVLQAIANEELAQNYTFPKLIKKYNLNSSSSVKAAIKYLLKKIVKMICNTHCVYDFIPSLGGWQRYIEY